MRLEFDPQKSRDVKRKHGVSLEEAQEIFDQVYLVDQKSDDPKQFRAIGWSRGRLCSVIFEIRHDSGENTTIWSRPGKQPSRKSKAMSKTSRTTPTADEIAEMASRGEDVSAYFTNKFTVVRPVRRINVDLTLGMLRELDARAARLNVSRQAVIKTLLRQALDQGRERRTGSKKAV